MLSNAPKQFFCPHVAVDEVARFGVEDNDGFRGVLDQCSIARLTIGNFLSRSTLCRYVACHSDVTGRMTLVVRHRRYCDVQIQLCSVADPAPNRVTPSKTALARLHRFGNLLFDALPEVEEGSFDAEQRGQRLSNRLAREISGNAPEARVGPLNLAFGVRH